MYQTSGAIPALQACVLAATKARRFVTAGFLCTMVYMNGDQTTQTPGGDFPKPGDNPPSLTEPGGVTSASSSPQPPVQIAPRTSLRGGEQTPATDVPRRSATATVQAPVPSQQAEVGAATGEEQGGFYHPASAVPASPLAGAASTDSGASTAERLAAAAATQVVSWTSSGEALQIRSAAWRVRMTLVSVVAAALIYLITRDLVPTIAIVLAGTLFGFLGSRRPPALNYQLDVTGITINQKRYAYGEFRAFSIVDYPAAGANLIPLKRFLPMLSIHFDGTQQDKIVAVLSNHLPMERPRNDAMDKLISRARF
jgi:hypothetical protein